MTHQEYEERRRNILVWLYSAIKSHCPRTARARVRDIARLTEEYSGTPYINTYNKLLEEYNL